ncbi:hypothetical protein F5Y17DRAFT_463741 [Xylariaceae sp. FL0594]|nr:hypothetical protein F5Y17DRAFT_463741 [Xylariaceae sp. FL0594]
MQAPITAGESELLLFHCVDGVLVNTNALYEPDFRHIEEIVCTVDSRGLWYIKLNDVTVAMALEFIKSRFAQEVIDSLRERYLERSQRSFSCAHLLAMESTQKMAVLRTLGQFVDPNKGWLDDLRSFSDEVERIANTGMIYWND